MVRKLSLILALLALLPALGPAQAIGVRRNLAPAPGPPVSVRVEMIDAGVVVVDQVLIGLVRRTGTVEVARTSFEIRPCPLGGRAAFGVHHRYGADLGLSARRPELDGVNITASFERSQSEQGGGHYNPKCQAEPIDSYSERIEQQIFLKRGQALEIPALDGLLVRLTLQ
jgi:hypothetical protein